MNGQNENLRMNCNLLRLFEPNKVFSTVYTHLISLNPMSASADETVSAKIFSYLFPLNVKLVITLITAIEAIRGTN